MHNRYNIYGNGQLIAKIEDGVKYYFHNDHLGSTRFVTDASEKIVFEQKYRPFGGELSVSGEEQYRFTGKGLDDATGLYYFNARWYDPEIGRFITEDPARDGFNWFVYCANNPLKYVDPSGMRPLLTDDPREQTQEQTDILIY